MSLDGDDKSHDRWCFRVAGWKWDGGFVPRLVRQLRRAWFRGMELEAKGRRVCVLSVTESTHTSVMASARKLVQTEFGPERAFGVPERGDDDDDEWRTLLVIASEDARGDAVVHDVLAHVHMVGATSLGYQAHKMIRVGVPEPSVRQLLRVVRGIQDERVVDEILRGGDTNNTAAAAAERSVSMVSLVVAPGHRGLGLGRALARIAAHQALVDHGFARLRGFAATEALMAFYEGLGATANRDSRPRPKWRSPNNPERVTDPKAATQNAAATGKPNVPNSKNRSLSVGLTPELIKEQLQKLPYGIRVAQANTNATDSASKA